MVQKVPYKEGERERVLATEWADLPGLPIIECIDSGAFAQKGFLVCCQQSPFCVRFLAENVFQPAKHILHLRFSHTARMCACLGCRSLCLAVFVCLCCVFVYAHKANDISQICQKSERERRKWIVAGWQMNSCLCSDRFVWLVKRRVNCEKKKWAKNMLLN